MTTPETIHTLPLDQIDDSPALNSRSMPMVYVPPHPEYGDLEDSEGNTYSRTLLSIATVGQDEPITVRPHPDPESPKKYECVTGFSRCAALRELAAMPLYKAREFQIPTETAKGERLVNISHPTVKAYILNLSTPEAHELNARENTARLNLPPADMAHAIARIKKDDPKRSDASIAQSLGRSREWVTILSRIASSFEQKVLDHWRSAATRGMEPIGTTTLLDLSNLPVHERTAAYFAHQKRKRTVSIVDRRRDAVMMNEQGRAEAMGRTLAALVREGFITCHVEPSAMIRQILPRGMGKRSYSEAEWQRFADACQAAYAKAQTGAATT